MMETLESRELESLAGLGAALWADPAIHRTRVLETVAAVSLQNVPEAQLVDRAATSLLLAATHGGIAANAQANAPVIGQPFFRLSPEDRFALMALHRARWSYARLARIFGESLEDLEARVWGARLRLAALSRGSAAPIPYPSGADGHKASCPEWNSKRPWAQQFLDEELRSGSERVFLQNHLMACDGCRATLMRCKDLYYALEAMLPVLSSREAPASDSGSGSGQEGLQFVRSLASVIARTRLARPGYTADYSQLTFGTSLKIFLGRPDVRWLLAALVAVFILLSARTGG